MEKHKQYKEWISDYLRRNNNYARGKCAEACTEMLLVFPELKRVRGYIHTFDGQFAHHWLEDDENYIIDPTASQFMGMGEYEAFYPGMLCRVGKCMNCGQEIYAEVYDLDKEDGHRYHCSDECLKELSDM